MDWSRAKTILILSFLFLNMILGFQLWTSKSKQTELAGDATSAAEELNRLLSGKNIRLSVELPRELPKLTVITGKFDESRQPGASIPLKTPTTLASILGKAPVKELTAISEIPHLDQYQFDPVMSKDGVFVFNQLYGTLPMFDVKAELYEQNGEITSYRQALIAVESGGEQREQEVIPAQLAVRSLVENYLGEGVTITDVRLGYHGQVYNSQTQYMIPSWRVSIGNGDIYYVQAFNGAVEIPQKVAASFQLPPASETP